VTDNERAVVVWIVVATQQDGARHRVAAEGEEFTEIPISGNDHPSLLDGKGHHLDVRLAECPTSPP
jgi:hypothetical protein